MLTDVSRSLARPREVASNPIVQQLVRDRLPPLHAMGDEAPMDEAKSAALQKLQAVMRGKVMRAELAQANFLRILMGSAAERLQAAFRGRQVRKMDKEELVKTATEKRAEFKKQQSI